MQRSAPGPPSRVPVPARPRTVPVPWDGLALQTLRLSVSSRSHSNAIIIVSASRTALSACEHAHMTDWRQSKHVRTTLCARDESGPRGSGRARPVNHSEKHARVHAKAARHQRRGGARDSSHLAVLRILRASSVAGSRCSRCERHAWPPHLSLPGALDFANPSKKSLRIGPSQRDRPLSLLLWQSSRIYGALPLRAFARHSPCVTFGVTRPLAAHYAARHVGNCSLCKAARGGQGRGRLARQWCVVTCDPSMRFAQNSYVMCIV